MTAAGSSVAAALRRARASRRRARRRGQPGSALVVTVPEVDRVAGHWRARLDPAAAQGMPAHVTTLFPFLGRDALDDGVESAVGSELAAVAPFEFRLERVARFPGVIYLAPEPAQPFVALTERLCRRWPSCLPYDGAYPTVVPHVTIAVGAEPPGLAEELETALPIAASARALELWVETDDGRWALRTRFPLGA